MSPRVQWSDEIGAIGGIHDGGNLARHVGVQFAVKNLRRNAKLEWPFPTANLCQPRQAVRVERVNNQGLVNRFYDKARSVSMYGI